MSGRTSAVLDAVTITIDGEAISAALGEPVSAALIASGKLAIARSPKFHRPRGPSCMRAACDGCLARVDGVPNVMTCRIGAREGLAVTTQNTLGSREVDLLRVTDWFFPAGLNHHELFAGVPGVQQLMQAFAGRVAGLGKLPSETLPPRPAARRDADVIVVGSGPSGMMCATKIAASGRSVEVIDDALVHGGSTRALVGEEANAWNETMRAFEACILQGSVRLRTSTTVAAIYSDDILIVGSDGAEIVNARALVIASGAHDGVIAFEGNDLPGVMSARAAGILLSHGVHLGKRVIVATSASGGDEGFGAAYARAASRVASAPIAIVDIASIVRASGTSRVKRVTLRSGDREVTHDADALIIDAPRAAAYELCAQAGAQLTHTGDGYVPKIEHGKIRQGVWVVGEACGTAFDPNAMIAQAHDVAAQIDNTA